MFFVKMKVRKEKTVPVRKAKRKVKDAVEELLGNNLGDYQHALPKFDIET